MSSGHVWQGRFKAFPIDQDDHLLTVLRYAERNPLRAELVERAEQWPWSSLAVRLGEDSGVQQLAEGPVPLPSEWAAHVNEALTEAELERVRHSVVRGTPFGKRAWLEETARELGLQASLRPRGRPRKDQIK